MNFNDQAKYLLCSPGFIFSPREERETDDLQVPRGGVLYAINPLEKEESFSLFFYVLWNLEVSHWRDRLVGFDDEKER